MFLSGILFVLFLAGCWLYCLTDAALTPASDFPGTGTGHPYRRLKSNEARARRRKRAWIAVISATFIVGAFAWVVARYLTRRKRAINLLLVSEALARHPATRSRQADPAFRSFPIGPDDDPEFIKLLAERIRDGY